MPDQARPIALDVHAHLIPLREPLLSRHGAAWRDGALLLDGQRIGLAALFQPQRLLAWMRQHQVAQAWVSVPPPVYRQHLDEAAAEAWCDYLNEGLAAICRLHAHALSPLLHLPLEHPALACRIAAAALAAGASRFAVAAGGHERIVYSDPRLEPLWRALGAAQAFVFVHPGHCCDTRLAPFYLHNLLGNPHETAVAVGHLLFGGVCDRHPGIRFCLAHGGGTVPLLAGRLQQGYDTARPGIDRQAAGPPAALLRRFMADCIVHHPGGLALAAEVFGADHIVFGSDWPFPMGLQDPQAALAALPPALRRAVCEDGARMLLREG